MMPEVTCANISSGYPPICLLGISIIGSGQGIEVNTMDKVIRSGYSRDQIVLDTPYPILEILSIEVRHELNEHGSMTVKAVLEPNSFGGFSISPNDVVQLRAGDDDMDIVFTGKVYSASPTIINEVGHIEFTAHTATRDMDFTAKSRSFQYHKMKYEELVQFVAETYDEGNSITTAALGEEIGAPIYQYEETDWAFLRRIASSKGSVLTANTTLPSATFWFGVPKSQKEVDIIAFDYTRGEAYETLGRPEYYYYEFRAREVLLLGDKVNLTLPDGTLYRLVVTEVKAVFKSDELVFHFRAEPTSYIKRHLCTNKRVKGITLGGTVIDVSRNHIKLHLDIDPEQDVGEAHWYPMAYESNQVWYTMPHVGEHINLCVTDEIHSGYGMTDVRGKTGKMAVTPVMGKPTEKYMQTQWGKTTALHEGDIEFDTQATNLVMDEESIHVFSNDIIVIHIENEINLGRTVGLVPTECGQMIEVAEETKNITIEAEEMLTFRVLDHGTAIEMTELTEYHTLLDLIHHDGTNKAPMPLLSSPGQEHDPATYKPPGYVLNRPESKPPEPPAPPPPPPQKEKSGGQGRNRRRIGMAIAIGIGVALLPLVAKAVVAVAVKKVAVTAVGKAASAVSGKAASSSAGKAAASIGRSIASRLPKFPRLPQFAKTTFSVGCHGSTIATSSISSYSMLEQIGNIESADDLRDAAAAMITQFGPMVLANISNVYSFIEDFRHLRYTMDNWDIQFGQPGYMRQVAGAGIAIFGMATSTPGSPNMSGSGGNLNAGGSSPSGNLNAGNTSQPNSNLNVRGNANVNSTGDPVNRQQTGNNDPTPETKVSSARDVLSDIKKVEYGSTDLSRMAIEHRREHNMTSPQRNVAVFEYVDSSGELVQRPFVSKSGSHAEEVAFRYLRDNNMDGNSVRRIYSEKEPCIRTTTNRNHDCARLINRHSPNANVTYSVDYGDTQESGRAARETLEVLLNKFGLSSK